MRRRFLMGNKSELPSEYTKLNYIENTGQAYIDSGYNRKVNTRPTRVVLDFVYTDVSVNGYVFGVANDDANHFALGFFCDATRQKFAFTRIGHTGSGVRFTDLDTSRHLFEYVYKEGVYFDGVLLESTIEAASATLTGSASETPFGIFTTLRNREPYTYALARIYSLQFWDDTGLARNYVPAQRKSDGEIGMYETVTKTFLTNSGTGRFIGG